MGEIMRQPLWLLRARKDIGVTEIPGRETHPVIWRALGLIQARWLGGDEAPWCGTMLAAWMLDSGVTPPPTPYRALAWRNWGQGLDAPIVGCVGVMARTGGGHVTMIVARDERGNLLGLGGNQDDGVRVSAFRRDAFLAFRWPSGQPFTYYELPTGNATAPRALS